MPYSILCTRDPIGQSLAKQDWIKISFVQHSIDIARCLTKLPAFYYIIKNEFNLRFFEWGADLSFDFVFFISPTERHFFLFFLSDFIFASSPNWLRSNSLRKWDCKWPWIQFRWGNDLVLLLLPTLNLLNILFDFKA